MRELEREGVIEAQRGVGYFVVANPAVADGLRHDEAAAAAEWAKANATATELISIALRLGTADDAILYWLVGTDGNDTPTPTTRVSVTRCSTSDGDSARTQEPTGAT